MASEESLSLEEAPQEAIDPQGRSVPKARRRDGRRAATTRWGDEPSRWADRPASKESEDRELEHPVALVDQLRQEGCRVVEAAGRRIAIFSVGDRFFALRDRCPHKGASLCKGTIGGTFLASAPQEYVYGRQDEVIRCPWHGWEFDLGSGRSLLEPDRVGVRTYPVTVRDGTVIVHT